MFVTLPEYMDVRKLGCIVAYFSFLLSCAVTMRVIML